MVALMGICLLSSCESGSAGKKGGGFFSAAMPAFLGGKKEKDEVALPKEEKPSPPLPTEFPIGSIQMVRGDENFVLIRSSKAMNLEVGTEMMTYALNGKPTSKLKLSPERKGSFVVADIVQGNPQKGDRVVAMGVMDSNSPTTRGLVPAWGGDGDVQILE